MTVKLTAITIVQEHITTVNTITIVLNVIKSSVGRSVTVMYICETMQQTHFTSPKTIVYFKFQLTPGLECSQKLNCYP